MAKKDKCKCPYCESELEMGCFEPAFCKPCGVKIEKCKKCGKPLPHDSKKCPECGD